MGELSRRSTTPAKATKKTPAKKVPAKKAAAHKAAVKKAPARKAAAKKAPGKKAAPKKAPRKKVSPHKAEAHRPKKTAKKAAGKKGGAKGPTDRRAGAGPDRRKSPSQDPTMALPQLPAPPEDPLAVLGLTEPLRQTDLRRAWRSFASRHHPDRGGDPVTFGRGQSAYDELTRRLSSGD